MVETISPVVHGGRNRSYWVSLLLHIVSTTITAAAFGGLLGFVGGLFDAPGDAWLIALAVVAGLYFMREAFVLPIPVPQRKKQVPEWWRNFYSRPVAALLYGVGLGVGYFTYLTYGTFVAVTIGAVVSGDPSTGAWIVGPFGFARAVALAWTGRTDADRSGALLEKLDALATSRGPSLVNGLAILSVGLSALVSLR
jgi:hypothetical protein